jgi:hypothetical protein
VRAALLTFRAAGVFGHVDVERLPETALSQRSDDHGTAVLHSFRPAEIEAAFSDGGPDRTSNAWASLGPIEAESAEMAAGRTQGGKVDPEGGEKAGACRRDFSSFLAEHDVFVRREKIGEVHTETTGKVVVANSGRTKLPRLAGQRPVSRSGFERNGYNPVEHLRYGWRGEAEIPISPAPDCRDQSCIGQLSETGTGGLRRDPRRKSKLARRQGTAIEKRREHRSPRRLADQRRYFGDERARNHFPYINSTRREGSDEHFDAGRSESLSATSSITFLAGQEGQHRADSGAPSVDNMMWGSDYPHSESTFPQLRKILAEILAGVPDDEQAKPAPDHDPGIAGGYTARVYGLDMAG